LGTPGHHWIRGAYIWAQEQYAQDGAYGMLNTSWASNWDPFVGSNVFWSQYYNWNTLIATAQFSWHQPDSYENNLKDAGWFYYDNLKNPYYDDNGDVIIGPISGSAEFHCFNAKYGDIFVARPTDLHLSNEGEKVFLRWNKNSESDVIGYIMYRLDPDSISYEFSYIEGREKNFMEISDVNYGTKFKVTAVDKILDINGFSYINESPYSNTLDIITKVDNSAVSMPKAFSMSQNYPNPFNSETVIKYNLPKVSQVTIKIFNLLGQEIKTLISDYKEAGFHMVHWDGRDNGKLPVATGIYIYKIHADNFNCSMKLILLK